MRTTLTTALTTVYNEQGYPILSFKRSTYGYFQCHGVILQKLISNSKATQMNKLAMELLNELKHEVVLTTHDDDCDYSYSVKNDKYGIDTIKLTGEGYDTNGLYTTEKSFPINVLEYEKIAEFAYQKDSQAYSYYSNSEAPKWRRIGVTEQDNTYIKGVDLDDGNKFKSFKMANVIGGIKKVFYTKV
jgi:hypothetical protein